MKEFLLEQIKYLEGTQQNVINEINHLRGLLNQKESLLTETDGAIKAYKHTLQQFDKEMNENEENTTKDSEK